MNMRLGLLVAARLAMERQQNQPPGIERGHQRPDGAEPEGVSTDARVRRPGGFQDDVLGIEPRHAEYLRNADSGERQAADPHKGIGVRNGAPDAAHPAHVLLVRSEEHTSEIQSLMRKSYAVFCLKKKK